jgi:Holliday junction resolvase RusA-like endonuclease
MIKFTLNHSVPSKKNAKRIVFVRGKTMILPSLAHKEWHEEQMWVLKTLKIPLQTKPVMITMTFYSDSKRRGDLDNKASSVLDLLKDAGIIEDDDWFHVPNIILNFGGVEKLSPHCDIELTEL